MREHLSIRFGNKFVARCFKHGFQLNIVFDNAVVHKRNAAVAALVGMGIFVGRRAVRRPAGMPDADAARKRRSLRKLFLKVCNSAFGFHNFRSAAVQHGDPGRIVPAVLQLFKTVQQYRRSTVLPNITYNSTHIHFFLYK